MTNEDTLSIRIPKSMTVALKEHERQTMVPTSRLVRKLVEQFFEAAREEKKP